MNQMFNDVDKFLTFDGKYYKLFAYTKTLIHLFSKAKEKKIVILKGSFYSYDGETLGNGLGQAAATLSVDPKLFQKLYSHVINGSPECLTPPPSTSEETSPISENLQLTDS